MLHLFGVAKMKTPVVFQQYQTIQQLLIKQMQSLD